MALGTARLLKSRILVSFNIFCEEVASMPTRFLRNSKECHVNRQELSLDSRGTKNDSVRWIAVEACIPAVLKDV